MSMFSNSSRSLSYDIECCIIFTINLMCTCIYLHTAHIDTLCLTQLLYSDIIFVRLSFHVNTRKSVPRKEQMVSSVVRFSSGVYTLQNLVVKEFVRGFTL
jgi:hypothetical protein